MMSKIINRIISISETIELSMAIPFVILAIIMSVFAVIGISLMYEADSTILEKIGGIELWGYLITAFQIMIFVYVITYFIRLFKPERILKEDE